MSVFEQHLKLLTDRYGPVETVNRPDGTKLIKLTLPVPSGWNKSSSTIWFVVPVGYPAAKPDCFWADNDLRLTSGGQPANSSYGNNSHGAQPGLWFSWHVGPWNPNRDDLITYVHVIENRLQEAR